MGTGDNERPRRLLKTASVVGALSFLGVGGLAFAATTGDGCSATQYYDSVDAQWGGDGCVPIHACPLAGDWMPESRTCTHRGQAIAIGFTYDHWPSCDTITIDRSFWDFDRELCIADSGWVEER